MFSQLCFHLKDIPKIVTLLLAAVNINGLNLPLYIPEI